MRILVAFIIASTLLIGCEQEVSNDTSTSETKPPTPETVAVATTAVFRDPIIPTIVELPTHALPVWREHHEQKPALILFSNDPFLKAIPEEIAENADQLVKNGSIKDLMAGLDIMTANPVLMQDMAVSEAIKAELFSDVYWVIATKHGILKQTEESFQEHLLRYGAFSDEQPPVFSKTESGFSGMIGTTAVHVVPPEKLPHVSTPVSLHFDLSYLSEIYLDEVRTPLFTLIKDTFKKIREKQWAALTVTISLNHVSGIRPLRTRYMGWAMSNFFSNPELIETELPDSFKVRENIFYLDTFFQNEAILELYQQALSNNPDDPSLHYGLYQIYLQMKKQEIAMDHLRQAILLDRAYSLEYLNLAQQANEQNQHLMAMDFFQLATQALPENVFIKLQLAQTYLDVNAPERATTLINSLQEEPWSEIYYPQIPKMLDSWLEQAKGTPASARHGE